MRHGRIVFVCCSRMTDVAPLFSPSFLPFLVFLFLFLSCFFSSFSLPQLNYRQHPLPESAYPVLEREGGGGDYDGAGAEVNMVASPRTHTHTHIHTAATPWFQ